MVKDSRDKFYTKMWFALLSLVFFAPLGIFLLYKYSHFGKKSRIVLTSIFGLIFVIAVFSEEEQSIPVTSNEVENLTIELNEVKSTEKTTEQNNSEDNKAESVERQEETETSEKSESEQEYQNKDNVEETTEADNKNLIAAEVVRVVDGDTIKVTFNNREETLRLLLVDTPETVHPNKPVQPFGEDASNFAKEILNGKDVGLEIDVSERDKYGRLLVYLWVNGKMFNEMLLEKGLARVAYIYEPNVKYVDQFRAIQRKAQEEGLGIWSIENYVQEDGFQDEDVSVNKEDKDSTQEKQNNGSQNNNGVYIAKVDLSNEYFTLTNNSDTDITLTGWKMVSIEGNQTYYFPDGFVLKAKTDVTVWSGKDAKDNPPSDLKWTGKNIWNNKGDDGVLFDNQGNEVDRK
jgi:micrococcal nuclease